jgi:hypothetical protein
MHVCTDQYIWDDILEYIWMMDYAVDRKFFKKKLWNFPNDFLLAIGKKITFTGLHIKQHDNFSITINQQQYIKDIQPISLTRARRMQQKDVVNKRKKQNLRGLIGNLLYGAVNTRPDLCSRLG